jgi:predicted nucleic acid-binding protein
LRILVDSSVWADFLNGFPSLERAALADLIAEGSDLCTCGVIVAEVFQGLRRDKGREELAEIFRELTYLEPPSIDLYFRAAEVYRTMRQQGKTIRSTIDCVIAVLADDNGCSVLARDRDLTTILQSGVLKAKLWPTGSSPS